MKNMFKTNVFSFYLLKVETVIYQTKCQRDAKMQTTFHIDFCEKGFLRTLKSE